MTIFFIVLGCLLLLILGLLFTKLNGGVSYGSNGFEAYIKLLFFKFQIYPRKKKKNKKEKSNKKTKKEAEISERKEQSEKAEEIKEKKANPEEQNQKTDILNLLRKQIEIISSIRGKLTITNLSIKMEIGTGDAAETAVLCGGLYAAVYTILGYAQNIFFVNRPEVVINPDYNGQTAKGEYKGEISARVITYILIAIKAAKIYLRD